MVFEADQLGFLVDKYGSDHVLLGTDYPYDMGETDPIGLVNKVSGLSTRTSTSSSGAMRRGCSASIDETSEAVSPSRKD